MSILRFLGTGTSTGVPQIGCQCEVCCSADSRDKRTRTSVLLSIGSQQILIDCGPDFRSQVQPLPFKKIDGVLITHAHYDHVGGLDDLRPFAHFGDVEIYAEPNVCQDIRTRMPYAFTPSPYPGVPLLCLHAIMPESSFRVGDIEITPIRVMHHKLPILGFRIGSLVYITDMKEVPVSELSKVKGAKILVVNALRKESHFSHQSLSEAISFAQSVSAEKTYFIHMSHEIGLHEDIQKELPENMWLAYDGLSISWRDNC